MRALSTIIFARIVEADKESRVFNDSIEWMLRLDIFKALVGKLGSPNINLFALRFNRQVPFYVSCRPDPEAAYTGGLSVDGLNVSFMLFCHSA